MRSQRIALEVAENGESADIFLPAVDRAAIRAVRFRGLRGGLTPVFGIVRGTVPGSFRVQARDVVGVVRAGNVDISVRPKCGVIQLAAMLMRCAGSLDPELSLAKAQPGDLKELLIGAFVDSVRKLLEVGIDEGYVTITEVGYAPKGRIDFSWFGSGLAIPTRYTHRKFTYDIPENRCVRSVLDTILLQIEPAGDLASVVRSLREDFPVPGVDYSQYVQVMQVSIMERYGRILTIGKLILDGVGIEPQGGNLDSQGMLFWMPRVFEDYVTSIAQSLSEASETGFDAQGRLHRRWLDAERNLPLRPDFSFWSTRRCLVVGDAKYKLLGAKARRSDLYQLYSYAAALSAPVGILAYVGSADDETLHFPPPNMTTVITTGLALGTESLDIVEKDLILSFKRALAIGQAETRN